MCLFYNIYFKFCFLQYEGLRVPICYNAYVIGNIRSEFEKSHLPGLEVIKLFSCSTQLSMEFFMLINVKMPTVVGILTFMSMKNSIIGLSEPNISQIS